MEALEKLRFPWNWEEEGASRKSDPFFLPVGLVPSGSFFCPEEGRGKKGGWNNEGGKRKRKKAVKAEPPSRPETWMDEDPRRKKPVCNGPANLRHPHFIFC